MKCIVFLGLLMIAVPSKAQVPFAGGCPKVSIKSNFVPTSYLGLWYEQQKYFAIFELGGKCVTATYSAVNGTTINVLNSNKNVLTGSPSSISGYATLKGAPEIADLIVVFPTSSFTTRAPYQVLETDYNNYAVVHACNDFGIISFRFLWILTRQRNPSDAIMKKAFAVIDKNKLPKSLLIQTDQSNCS